MTYSPDAKSFTTGAEPVEAPAFTYRKRRARSHDPAAARRRWRMFAVGFAAIGAFALVMLFATPLAPARRDPAAARADVWQSLAFLKAGNSGAARGAAQKATMADPGWGLAHAVYARTLLATGDGIGAEGELNRARAAGFDGERVHQLYAHAWLLQKDPARALKEARRAGPRFAAYAARITARAQAMRGDLAAARDTLVAVLRANPADSAAWTDLARVRLAAGDASGAVGAVSRAVALDPGNVEALLVRAGLVRTQFGLVAALPWYEAALKHDPGNHDALIDYAATLGDAGRTRDMLAAVRRAMAAKPGSAQALFLQSILAARAGDYDLARDLYNRTGDALADTPAAMLLAGSLAYEAGSDEQAIERLRPLVGIQPMNIAARKLLGAALLRSGDAPGALDILRPAALRGDADSYTLTLAARAFEATGNRAMADRLLDRARIPARSGSTPFGTDDSLAVLADDARQAPHAPGSMLDLVRGLIDAGDTAGALARAQGLVRDNPGAAQAHLILGDTFATAGRFADAAAAYAHAADIRFDTPTLLRLVDALDRSGQRARSANTLALFLSQNPDNVAALRLAAHWQIAAEQWDAAVATLERLRLRLGDRDAALLAELALASSGAGDDDAATTYGAAAYRLAPSNPAVVDAYGWTMRETGDGDGAVQLLEKAIALVPSHPVYRWHLAQAYLDAGRKADAAVQARAALADPGFADRTAAQAVAG